MNYSESTNYWIYNYCTIISKPSFNNNIDLIDFNDNIVSLIFTNYEEFDNVIKALMIINILI